MMYRIDFPALMNGREAVGSWSVMNSVAVKVGHSHRKKNKTLKLWNDIDVKFLTENLLQLPFQLFFFHLLLMELCVIVS